MEVEDKPPIAVPMTVGQALAEELDLSLREPFNDLLVYLHSVAQNSQEKQRLETWLEIIRQRDDHPDSIALKKTITDNCMSVVDLFDEFPFAAITLAAILELLPKQKEEREVKQVARELLDTLKREKLVLDWRKAATVKGRFDSRSRRH